MGIGEVTGPDVYQRSVTYTERATYFLARGPAGKSLGVVGEAGGFDGVRVGSGSSAPLLCPLTAVNAAALRERLLWLCPQPLGLARSAGCGDRLGLATPGHVRAVRAVGGFAPIFPQQSMRENARTGRSPQQVMDDAMWGVFQEGWREPWGADADHLKTTGDVDLCLAAGYTFYTVDPGAHVDNEAHTAEAAALFAKLENLPWGELEDSPDRLRGRYLDRTFSAEGFTLAFDEVSLARAAAKYGRAVAHSKSMYRHLVERMRKPGRKLPQWPDGKGFELEVSVDETETPTSPLEHWYVASELHRLGVECVSLAPRYVGRFEKGVDYIGDLDRFGAELAVHAAIARSLGPYKLSIHSGSDKFSVYPLFARHAGELVHLKTAGTSYLEALRTIATADPELFCEILAFARRRYNEDRATYHVSADASRLADFGAGGSRAVPTQELAAVLDQFDGREVLHVTFGSVLDRYGRRLSACLAEHEDAYYAVLQAHFGRHLRSFEAGNG